MRLLIALCLTLTLLIPGTAFADGLTARFDAVELSLEKGQMTLKYEVVDKSWKQLEEKKVPAHLNLYELQKDGERIFLYSFELKSKKGSITFPKRVSFSRGGTYELDVEGFSKQYFIKTTRRAKSKERTIQFVRNGKKLEFKD